MIKLNANKRFCQIVWLRLSCIVPLCWHMVKQAQKLRHRGRRTGDRVTVLSARLQMIKDGQALACQALN